MSNILTTIKSPATWVLVLSALVGALNALQPLLHPRLAEWAAVLLAVLGAILHGIEKHEALLTPPPEK